MPDLPGPVILLVGLVISGCLLVLLNYLGNRRK